MTNSLRNKCNQCLCCTLKRRRCDIFKTLNGMTKYFTLVQLMDNLGNETNSFGIYGVWIFEVNDEKTPLLVK